jgi:hypothetical protein
MGEALFWREGGGVCACTASLLNDMGIIDVMVAASVLIFTLVSIAYCVNIMIMICCCNSLSWHLFWVNPLAPSDPFMGC